MASTLSCFFPHLTTLSFLLLLSPNSGLASRTLQVPKRPQTSDLGFVPPSLVEPTFPTPDNSYDVTPTLPSFDAVIIPPPQPPPPPPPPISNGGDNQDLSTFPPSFPFPTFPKLPIPHFPFMPKFPGVPLPPFLENSDMFASSTMSKGKYGP